MLEIINEIKYALKSKHYISALALSLTLPDICSQVETQNKKDDVGVRYRNWIDKYIDKELFEFPVSGFEDQTFDSEKIYQLRCHILHSGNSNIDDSNKINIDKFILLMPDNNPPGYKYIESHDTNGNLIKVSYIRVDYLCESICAAAETFYNSWGNPNDFDEFTINFEK